MDPFTHGLAGAIAAQSIASEKTVRAAGFTGFISAMIADLDFFIHDPSNPLLNVEVHRQFTHSLLFVPVGALIASLLLWWFMRRRFGFSKLYLFALVSYATAGLLDACTSYGTVLLWPIDDTRYAWNLISILDPLFSGILFLLAASSFYDRKRILSWIAIGWVMIYLSVGYAQRERADRAAHSLAQERGDSIDRLIVKPTMGNLILWRSTYQTDDQYRADALRVGLFSGVKIYEGDTGSVLNPEQEWSEFESTVLYEDLIRFQTLSDGWLIRHPEDPTIVGDARYAMLPTSLKPLWGVKVRPEQPDEHLPFLYFREAGRDVRDPFLEMLMGRGSPEIP